MSSRGLRRRLVHHEGARLHAEGADAVWDVERKGDSFSGTYTLAGWREVGRVGTLSEMAEPYSRDLGEEVECPRGEALQSWEILAFRQDAVWPSDREGDPAGAWASPADTGGDTG